MATQDGADAPPTVGLALSGSKSSAYVLRWALAKFANDNPAAPAAATFRLIHVLTPVLAVPTPPPVGNYLPIDQVRPEIAEAYVQEVWVKAQKMLAGCKETCDENKVEAQVLLVNGNDVADTISNLVAQHQIQILVVGASRGFFNRTSSKICKGVPSFCTAYVVSKDGSSSVYDPGSEIDVTTGSGVPKGNCSSSSTEVFSEDSSLVSDLYDNSLGRGLSGFPSLPPSNLASGNLQSTASSESHVSFTLYDHLTGRATVYNDNNRIAESSIASKLRGSDKVPTQDNSLRQLMLSDNKDAVNTVQFDFDTELEKLRLELRDIRGAYKLESVDASHQVVESAARGMEGEGQLREIQSRVDKDNNDTQEEMEHRLLAQTSKDADKKLRLEKRSVLQGNSYLAFTWEEIDNATASFSELRKIGTGSNGTVYRGHLNDLEVAIKVLHSNDKTSTKHFNQE